MLLEQGADIDRDARDMEGDAIAFLDVSFQRAIVIGASSGIGAAVVKQLLASGAEVALVARRREPLDGVAAAAPTRARPTSTTSPRSTRPPSCSSASNATSAGSI